MIENDLLVVHVVPVWFGLPVDRGGNASVVNNSTRIVSICQGLFYISFTLLNYDSL